MTWLGYRTVDRACFSENGLPPIDGPLRLEPRIKGPESDILASGSIVFDVNLAARGRSPARLLHFARSAEWWRQFSFYFNADRSISIEAAQGQSRSYVRLNLPPQMRHARLLVTYSWHGPSRTGLLTAEDPLTGSVHQAWFHAPLPMPLADARAMISETEDLQIDERLQFLAVSDKVEPVGPLPSIAEGTLVETTDGLRPVENLRAGDRMPTAGGQEMEIRWIARRTVPAAGPFLPYLVRSPWFGLERSVLLAPRQLLMIGGADAEYIFGEEAVLAPVESLARHPGVEPSEGPGTITYCQVLFDSHECINVSGLSSESLFLGTLARSPAILATTCLADLPAASAPVHRTRCRPVIGALESQELLASLTA